MANCGIAGSHVWHEFVHEAETRILDPVERAANKLSGRRGPVLVTDAGVEVSLDDMRDEMQARRKSEHLRARADLALPPTVLAKGVTYDIMAHSDVLLTCSGTATLEAAVLGTPLVIMYRGSKIMEIGVQAARHQKENPDDRPAQHSRRPHDRARTDPGRREPRGDCRPCLALLNDPARRQQAKKDLAEVRAALGTPGASERAAQLVLELARRA